MIHVLNKPERPGRLDAVRLNLVATPWDLEPGWRHARASWLAKHPGEWNGKRLGVARLRLQANGAPELDVCETDWATIQAAHERVDASSTVPELPVAGAVVEMRAPCAAVLHASLVSADGVIVMTERALGVRYHPGTWSATLEEGLELQDLDSQGKGGLERVLLRGVREELGEDVARMVDAGSARYVGTLWERELMNPAIVAACWLARPYAEVAAAAKPAMAEVASAGVDGVRFDAQAAWAGWPEEPPSLVLLSGRRLAAGQLHPTAAFRLWASMGQGSDC